MFRKENIITTLKDKGWSRYKLCKEANMAQSTLSDILGGKNVNPRMDTLQRIADTLEVPINTFFDDDISVSFVESDDSIVISKKAERDIQKSLSETLDMLKNNQAGLMFDGEPLDDLTRELLAESLETSMKLAKKLQKKNIHSEKG